MTGVKNIKGAVKDAGANFRAFIQKRYEIPLTNKPFMMIGGREWISGILKLENVNMEINEHIVAVKKYMVFRV